MVNKITVTALVLIVACPILLGYAMAFEDVTNTYYVESDSKNVTGLLRNSTEYNYTLANTYTINSRVWATTDVIAQPTNRYYPEYRTVGDTYTSIPIGIADTVPAILDLTQYSYYFIDFNVGYDPANRVAITTTNLGSIGNTYSVNAIEYYGDGKPLIYYWNSYGVGISSQPSGVTSITFDSSNYSGTPTIRYTNTDGTANKYADFVDGYDPFGLSYSKPYSATWSAYLYCSEVVITMDLNVLTADPNSGYNYQYGLGIYANGYPGDVTLAQLRIKEVSGQWTINDTPMVRSSDSSMNVWQFVINKNGTITANYIGGWPIAIGKAYAYQSIEVTTNSGYDYDIQTITLWKYDASSERVRVDLATARSNEYPIISNQTYDPATLNGDTDGYRTTISKADILGDSITFAGTTYSVNGTNLVIGTKKTPINGLTFVSEKQQDGTYLNYIDGFKPAATSSASAEDVTFNGKWSMIVTTAYTDMESKQETQWTPGKFAWNGVDQSFALMGLITCAAVFVGLGMYGARSGAKVGKLMIICGCAAFVFLALM